MVESQEKYTIYMVCTDGRIEGKNGDEGFILDKYNPDGDDFAQAWESELREPVDEDFHGQATQFLQVFSRYLIAQMLGETMLPENERPENMREVSSEVVKIVSEVTNAIANIWTGQSKHREIDKSKSEESEETLTEEDIKIKREAEEARREMIEEGRATLTRLLPELPGELDVSTVVEEWKTFLESTTPQT